MTRFAPAILAIAVLVIALAARCGGGDGVTVAQPDGTAGADTVLADSTLDSTPSDDASTCPAGAPEGHATMRMLVDDRARRTFEDGELVWTGSFRIDETTAVVTYATSWLPEEGPYPRLYDDGPRSACGHEMEGAVAGDHIFTTEVYFADEEERTIDYGVLNELLNWMWIGPNGQLTVPAGSTDVFYAEPLVIPPCGVADIKLTIDLNALDEEAGFSGIAPGTRDVYVKGTMNAWTDRLIVDNGKRGDAAADDGVYTFVLSENLGGHDCLLLPGGHAQFVFSFYLPDQGIDTAQEYKGIVDGTPTALGAGVTAFVDVDGPEGPGSFVEIATVLEPDSRGNVMNTAIVMPGTAASCDEPGPDADCPATEPQCFVGACPGDCEPSPGVCLPCFADDHCTAGACEMNRCTSGGGCDGDEDCPNGVCEAAVCVACRADGDCPDGGVCVANGCLECREDGDCDEGEVCRSSRCEPEAGCTSDEQCLDGICDSGSCRDCREDGDCDEGERCTAFHCEPEATTDDPPLLYQIEPASGPVTGGTTVTLRGLRFEDGMTVAFEGIAATEVTVTSAILATCVTPAGALGPADVTVKVDSRGSSTFYQAFQYVDPEQGPRIDSLAPSAGPAGGGTEVVITGANFTETCQVSFGGTPAPMVFLDAGHIRATSPAGSVGAVDVTVADGALQDTCTGCFSYEPERIDWAGLLPPATVSLLANTTTPTLYAKVYEPGVTDGEGMGAGITAHAGYGPDGSDPSLEESGWTWQGTTFDGDSGNDDVFSARFTPDTAGEYDFAFRFSLDGGTTWYYADTDFDEAAYDPAAAGRLSVAAPPAGPFISTVDPPFGALVGGETVTIGGLNFDPAATVHFGDAQAVIVSAEDKEITVTTPPGGAVGSVGVTVTNPGDDEFTLDDAYYFGLVHTPTLDGALGDWPEAHLLATNDIVTDWAGNELHQLYAAVDADRLYVAIEGRVEPGNTIVAYVDLGFGTGSGLTWSNQCQDDATQADLDDALCVVLSEGINNSLHTTVPGFGADVAFGSRAMLDYANDPGCDDLGQSEFAGWRRVSGLTDPADLPWLCSQVVVDETNGVLETSVALSELFQGQAPDVGTEIAIVVRIVNDHGNFTANQGLPPVDTSGGPAAIFEMDDVVTLRAR